MPHRIAFFALLCFGLATAGCEKSKDPAVAAPPEERRTLITVAAATTRNVEVVETSVGQLESPLAPVIATEINGRIKRTLVDQGDRIGEGQLLAELDEIDLRHGRDAAASDLARLRALVRGQELTVNRLRDMVKQNFVTQAQLDEAESQLAALQAQASGAEAALAVAERDLGKTRILASTAGRIDERRVSAGDYVKSGDPLFGIVAAQRLRVRLTFPETVAGRIQRGQIVRLSSPAAPTQTSEGVITEVRPAISAALRAVEVIVEVDNSDDWRPGASVDGAVIIERRSNAVTVPEQSVVNRPAGQVVYAIKDGVAHQHIVQTGVRRDGWVELRSGLAAGEQIAFDGASFLTDKAAVTVQDTAR